MTVHITSPANPRVKQLVELRRRRVRIETETTVIEGHAELTLALDVGVRPRQLYVAPDLLRPRDQDLVARVEPFGTEVVTLSAAAFAKASYRESPDGWLAVVATPGARLDELDLPANPLLLVCEGVEKPGNLGAMLRTAEAAGVAAVVAADPVADWGNPNVVRASKGTVFAVPVAAASTSDAIAWLTAAGTRIVVATPEADLLLDEADLTGSVAIVVGAEHAGVSDAWRSAATVRARLPMTGRVNSLNVSTSAAVFVYEALRQRGRDLGIHS